MSVRYGPPIWIKPASKLGIIGAILWTITVFCWGVPILWRVGNAISDLRYRLYAAYGWEWI